VSIRIKAFLAVGVTLVLLGSGVYAGLEGVLLRRFDAHEERSVLGTVRRAQEALTDDLRSLHTVTSDWARWDDLYAFIAGKRPEFIRVNVVDETFRNLRLNVMVFVHASGRVVASRGFDLERNARRGPASPSLQRFLEPGGVLVRHPDTKSSIRGVLLLPEGPLLVSSWPILTSEGHGPIRGTLIWGRFLDAPAVRRLAERTGLSLTVHRLDDPGLPRDVRTARGTLSPEHPLVVRPLDDELIAGYALVTDLNGQPALAIRVVERRLIHEQGRAFARYLAWSLLLAVVTSGAAIVVLLNRLIVSRLERLSGNLEAIGTSGSLSARVIVPGHDELGSLAAAINQMLGGLERAQEERRRATESLRQQLGRISLLNQITRAIAERQDLPSIFRVVLDCLEDQLPIDFGEVLCEAEDGTLSIVAVGPKSRGLAAETELPQAAPLSAEAAGLAACHRRQTVYLADMADAAAPELRRLARLGLRSAVGTPLAADGRVFGMLVVARRAPDGFASAEVDFLRSLAEHVALAASQTRLHEELRQAYDELRQSQQTVMRQERLRALGQMASGITHDINNALSPVVGYADLLLKREPLGDRSRRFVEKIRIAGQDIGQTIARMRDFYRQRADDEPLRPVDLNQVALEVVDLTQPRWKDMAQAQGRAITVRTDLGGDLPPVPGVESELRSAVINLVFNAVDAMPEGGTITLRTRRDAEHVALEVVDTGTGMDEATRDRCLEPFFTTKGERGTGLGLAMVHGIARRHEGTIELDTAPGRGTTVRLLFPVPHAIAVDRDAEDGAAEVRPLQILCIDDEPPLRDLLAEMLEADGHTVVAAESGEAGLRAFAAASARGGGFDVVITDLGMPGMDGREVARALKAESPDTPVILLTGWGARVGREREAVAGFDAIVTKPPRLDELAGALMRATQRRRVHAA